MPGHDDCSGSTAEAWRASDENPLDLVYELVAFLCVKKEGVENYRVLPPSCSFEVSSVIGGQSSIGLQEHVVVECIQIWDELGVLWVDGDRTFVKFLVSP